MKLQVGFDDFGKVRSKKLDFVDKTLFVKEILDNDNVEVSVIARPRRFGKTFNLSILHHFLAPEVNHMETKGMFDGLKIAKVDNSSYMQYQGIFSVIFVSFKSIKNETFQGALKNLRLIVQKLYRTHRYLLNSDHLGQDEKNIFKNFLVGKIEETMLEAALETLSEFLYKDTGRKVYLLVDEYDTPIQSGYLYGYYNEIVNFMRGILGAALKTNPYLERAVITGILRIAKESLFSGLNNVKVYSLLHPQYSRHFGFTEEEVGVLLKQTGVDSAQEEVRTWYNGYVFGGTIVYNPWSIVNYINDGVLKPYWVNTSDNQLIRDLLIKSDPKFKEGFELLLQDKTIEEIIDENMMFGDLKNNNEAIWSLLLMSGYLQAIASTINQQGQTICTCAIPNWEVRTLYYNIIAGWLGNGQGMRWYQSFLTDLLNGDIPKFTEDFAQVLSQTISVYDAAHNPEAFYHGFMLGLTAGVDQKQYEIKSNRESGAGRYDIAIMPKDVSRLAIILELKSIAPPKYSKKKLADFLDTTLAGEAQKALAQIDRNQYTLELTQRGIVNIVKLGIAFSGKSFRIASENSEIRQIAKR